MLHQAGKNLRSWLSRHGRSPNDDGLTLVELIVVIAVIPLIVGAISVALITVISQTNTATAKTTDSGDATVLSANYGPDVLGASQVTTYSGAPALSPPICGTGSPVVSLQWGTSPTVVTYAVQSQVQLRKTSWVLHRYECFGKSATPSNSHVVARNVQNPSGPTPLTATIGGSSTSCTPPNTANCAQSAAKTGWIFTQGVSSISIQVKAPELGPTSAPTSAYTYTLSAVPRASSNASRGSTPPGGIAPLFVVPGNGTANCGNANLTVYGAAAIEATGGPPTIGNLHGVTNVTGGIDAVSGTTFGSGVEDNGTPTTSPNAIITNPADPYANIVPPSTAGLQTFQSTNPSNGPGIYQNGIVFPGTMQLQSGVYIVVSNGVSQSGAMNITNAPGGVLFYIEGGGWSVQGTSSNQTLTAWTSAFSPAPGLLIWEAKGDNSTISLGGGGPTNNYQGTVYAPSGTVQSNGSASPGVSSVVAATVACGNGSSGSWTIGSP